MNIYDKEDWHMTNADMIVYNAIKEYINEKGYAPTIRELCELTGKSSTSTIHARLMSLEKSGYIKTHNGKCRTIQLSEKE